MHFIINNPITVHRGYAVSNFATDGFAMLKAEYFYKTKNGKKRKAAAESD